MFCVGLRKRFILTSLLLATCSYSLKTSVNINCGGPSNVRFYSDIYPPNWLKVWGGAQISEANGAFISGAESKNRYALGSHRWKKGNFGYVIFGMEPGFYECTLHFAETSNYWAKPGKRVFEASIEGKPAGRIDVYGSVRSMYKSYTRTVKGIYVNKASQSMSVEMRAVYGDAMLSAITCQQTRAVVHNPVQRLQRFNINCGGETRGEYVSDLQGNRPSWLQVLGTTRTYKAETKYFGGNPEGFKNLLLSERYAVNPSSFKYRIANVEPAYWYCILHFAETYWSQPGKRIFKVSVNFGTRQQVDVYRSVGMYKEHRIGFEPFYVSGTIEIIFERYKGDPMVSAITCGIYTK